MNSPAPSIDPEILAQREQAPALYASVDFTIRPERFTDDPEDESELWRIFAQRRPEMLAKTETVALARKYTMRGDPVCDAYAALMPKLGFRKLVAMLEQACDDCVEAVADAPPELATLIAEMAAPPPWLDMARVAEGAKALRNDYAHLAPYFSRGALLGTFLNRYTALPMAMTGAFSTSQSRRRILETSAFFTLMVTPGALDRHGPGFKAAAKVRLMHSLVRFHALRSSKWDLSVYGVPIPQIDQMSAGILDAFFLSVSVLESGRKTFTPEERAKVELARYRSHLLGVPQALLPDTPEGIVDIMLVRMATIRKDFDDDTCGALVRGTMEAKLSHLDGVLGRFEPSLAKLYLLEVYLGGDRAAAAAIGVPVTRVDRLIGGLCWMMVQGRKRLYDLLLKTPGLKGVAERRLVAKLNRVMKRYGHAEFETDAKNYQPARSLS